MPPKARVAPQVTDGHGRMSTILPRRLGLFALPLSLGAALANNWSQIHEYGLMQGFDNAVVWIMVLMISIGGLLVAATMKCAAAEQQ